MKDKLLIFTITPGRSGSKYLSTILNALQDVDATHEPEPSFAYYYPLILENKLSYQEFWNIKIDYILENYNKNIYVETSHIFSFGFVDSFIKIYPNFKIILLQRDIRDITLSFYQLNGIPGSSKKVKRHTLYPTDNNNIYLKLPLNIINIMSDYQLCYWYVLEIFYRMFLCLNKNYSVELNLDDLKDEYKITEFLNKLDIPIDNEFFINWENIKNLKINEKKEKKDFFKIPSYIQQQEEYIKDNILIKNKDKFFKKYNI